MAHDPGSVHGAGRYRQRDEPDISQGDIREGIELVYLPARPSLIQCELEVLSRPKPQLGYGILSGDDYHPVDAE